jgi:alkyl hydroperoxide reductase subunit F
MENTMLDANLTQQLKQYLAMLREPIELVATLGDDRKSAETRELLSEIAALHELVSARFDGSASRRPSFLIRRIANPAASVEFAGLPMGHEFTSLVLALLWAGGHPPKFSDEMLRQVRELDGEYCFEMYFSLSCHNCPDVVQALALMALENPRVHATLIEGGTFKEEVDEQGVMAVPAVFLDGAMWGSGKMSLEEILARLDSNAGAKAAAKLAEKEPFDVLIVGGGPAAAAASIYAARKGFRTGIATERFGGQVLDTLGIENFISLPYTEGPKLAAQLEQHVAENDVDVMAPQTAAKLSPAKVPCGVHQVQFANRATLKARSIVLATGARWRQLGVPGEEQYRNKGVAYCPHCDGPLFKGKRVAVIGGGNSGVEAAIDLANLVAHVTLIEYADSLRADQVLKDKLFSLKNVDVVHSAETTEITGEGERVNGLIWRARHSGNEHRVELEGVFVQIGLVPNTEWLVDSGLELNRFGEIAIDARAATNLPGIFAAGDATTVPYKQIVIAMGEGSKAALSAFDYLIRHEPVEDLAEAA